MTWTLMVHGGAGRIDRDALTPAMDAGARAGLAQALDAGAALLAAGGDALDAVQAAVEVLEDDPHFNAGRGAVCLVLGAMAIACSVVWLLAELFKPKR